MSENEKTTIQVSVQTKTRLNKLVKAKGETYDEILKRILSIVEKR
jgi:predicted DNA-binding protein